MTKTCSASKLCSSVLGRPRSFDTTEALKSALEVFWEKGYEGASINDLTEAMGINKPSLYAAFGNKEQLFLKAVELYEQRPNSFFYVALEQPTAYQVAEKLLFGAAEQMSDHSQPQGCMLIQSALACGESASLIKDAVVAKRISRSRQLQERLDLAKQQGDLPADTDTGALTHYLATLVQGMSVHATNGASLEDMQKVAGMALATFPRSQ